MVHKTLQFILICCMYLRKTSQKFDFTLTPCLLGKTARAMKFQHSNCQCPLKFSSKFQVIWSTGLGELSIKSCYPNSGPPCTARAYLRWRSSWRRNDRLSFDESTIILTLNSTDRSILIDH